MNRTPLLALGWALLLGQAHAADNPSLKVRQSLKGHTRGVFHVGFSPDGKKIASAGKDHSIRIHEVATGKELLVLKGHTSTAYSTSWSPDGKKLASASEDRSIRLWDAATGELQATLQGHNGEVFHVAWSPDGKNLASCGGDYTVRLWDVAGRKQILSLGGHRDRVLNVAWSPDGKRLASASSATDHGPAGHLKLWDVQTGKEVVHFQGDTAGSICVVFSPDGRWLASSGTSGNVVLWETISGLPALTLSGKTQHLYGLRFTRDGLHIIASSGNWSQGPKSEIKVWSLASGSNVLTFNADTHLWAIDLNRDGRTLAAGTGTWYGQEAGSILLHDLAGLATRLANRDRAATRLELEQWWLDLSAVEARKAYSAGWQLRACPKEAVPYLLDAARKVPVKFSREQAARLIAELEHRRFAVREKAMTELARLGREVEPMLREALDKNPSADARKRLEELLDRMREKTVSAEALRAWRVAWVLEAIGTAEARKGLEVLSRGPEGDPMTREARAALTRLSAR